MSALGESPRAGEAQPQQRSPRSSRLPWAAVRECDPHDRRATLVGLTAAGTASEIPVYELVVGELRARLRGVAHSDQVTSR